MTREIPLTKGKIACVDDADYGWLSAFRWRCNAHGYAIRSYYVDGKEVYCSMHREIMRAQTGQVVDHIDHDRLNNTRANLRLLTRQQNLMYRQLFRNSTSGFKGVNCQNGKWHARIQLDHHAIHLGHHDDLLTAALVYDCAARQLFGAYAVLNLPDTPPPPAVEALVAQILARHRMCG